jgi:hypothetical protein
MNINDTLAERGERYGHFAGHALVTQQLKLLVADHLKARDKTLTAEQREALDMIFHKIGRIVNGDPNYPDSWVDIAGYAQLVANTLTGDGVQ